MNEIRRPGVRRSASAETFLRELERGMLPVPFGPALSTDCYEAYCLWMATGHHGHPSPLNDFVTAAVRYGGAYGTTLRMARLNAAGFEEQGTHARFRILAFGTPAGLAQPGQRWRCNESARERRRLRRGVKAFRFALASWRWQRRQSAAEMSRVSTVTLAAVESPLP